MNRTNARMTATRRPMKSLRRAKTTAKPRYDSWYARIAHSAFARELKSSAMVKIAVPMIEVSITESNRPKHSLGASEASAYGHWCEDAVAKLRETW